jgi:hypothetical protein
MAKTPKTAWRCDEVLVTLVLREYDVNGRPINEQVVSGKSPDGSPFPLKVYRGQSENFWGLVDITVEKFIKGAK